MTAIAAEQMAMVKLNTKMKNWEKKYNNYLKTVSGYASAIKAATTLYSDGMQTLTAYGMCIQPAESIHKVLQPPYL